MTPLQMNKSHICSMSKKNEKRLYLTVHRLTEPGCQLPHWAKVGEKCLLLPYSVKKTTPSRKETAPRNINGTSCYWGWRAGGVKKKGRHTHTLAHTHESKKIQNTQYGPHTHGKPDVFQAWKSQWNGYYLIIFFCYHVLLKNISLARRSAGGKTAKLVTSKLVNIK